MLELVKYPVAISATDVHCFCRKAAASRCNTGSWGSVVHRKRPCTSAEIRITEVTWLINGFESLCISDRRAVAALGVYEHYQTLSPASRIRKRLNKACAAVLRAALTPTGRYRALSAEARPGIPLCAHWQNSTPLCTGHHRSVRWFTSCNLYGKARCAPCALPCPLLPATG